MRVDHFAYQRGTRVAGFGLLLQVVIAVVMLLFSLTTGELGDTAGLFGALYCACGPLLWLSLIVLFHQHKLERLEALEESELSAARAGTGSIFESAGDEVRVAARRLARMHKWMMPVVSLLLAAVLSVLAWRMWSFMQGLRATGEEALEAGTFALSPSKGWMVAICLAFAAVSFIFSRFVAGMAKHEAWQNLRGGAGFMVGNALVLFAIAAGVIFRFFNKDQVIEGVAFAIPVLMALLALEIAVNFVLNLYRPRIPGETPRPAFDSRLLGMLAAPDSLVRSINEAVNYQFGFDVTSTWGYQLLMRSVAKLVTIAVIALVMLSTMEVIEPHQQAVKLTGGRITGDEVHESGLMWKLPWPFQTAETVDVWRVRELPLTARRTRQRDVNVWTERLAGRTDRELEPFLVGASRFGRTAVPAARRTDDAFDDLSRSYSLVDAEIVLHYRVRPTGGGLLDYLRFAPDIYQQRQLLTTREKALRALALREASLLLSSFTLDEVLARKQDRLAGELARAIQARFDAARTGVEVVAVTLPLLRPAGDAIQKFEDLAMATQDLELIVAAAERSRLITLAYLVGDPARADQVVALIGEHDRKRETLGPDDPATIEARETIERILVDAGGTAGQQIARAYADRWVELLSTRSDAVRVQGQVAAFRASPDLYRQREIMRVYRENLLRERKYVLGIDPSRVSVDVELKTLSPLLDFESTLPAEEGAGP